MMDKSTVNSFDASLRAKPFSLNRSVVHDLFTNIQAEYSGALDTLRFLQRPVTQRKISIQV